MSYSGIVHHCQCLKSTQNEPLHDKTSKLTVRPAKTQISLSICPVWSESSLCNQCIAKDPNFLHADSKDSDQTGWMPRLIWVFAGCTSILLVLSWGDSNIKIKLKETFGLKFLFVIQFPKCLLYVYLRPTSFGKRYRHFSFFCKRMDIFQEKVYIFRKVT